MSTRLDNPESHILSLDEAVKWRDELRRSGRCLVITNGCFDIMHRGHAYYLREAALEGDALLVLVNTDQAIHAIKGPKRPIIGEKDRLYMLASLQSVDRVVLFDSARCDKELEALAPDVYVKGGDYTPETLDRSEYAALMKSGSRIVIKSFVPGFSTTNIIKKILADA